MRSVIVKNLIVVLVFVPQILLSQNNFFIELSANYPFIPDSEMKLNNGSGDLVLSSFGTEPEVLTEKFEIQPGIGISFGVERKLSKRFTIESGFSILNVNYQRLTNEHTTQSYRCTTIIPVPDSLLQILDEDKTVSALEYYMSDSILDLSKYNFVQPNLQELGKTNVVYFEVPVQFNYELIDNRLDVGIGVVVSFLGFSNVKRLSRINCGVEPIDDSSGNGFSNTSFAANVDVSCRVFEQLWVTTAYKQNFTKIYDAGESYPGDARLKMITIGLKYVLGDSFLEN